MILYLTAEEMNIFFLNKFLYVSYPSLLSWQLLNHLPLTHKLFMTFLMMSRQFYRTKYSQNKKKYIINEIHISRHSQMSMVKVVDNNLKYAGLETHSKLTFSQMLQ